MIQSAQPIKILLKQWEAEGLLTALDRHFALELTHLHQQQLAALDAGITPNNELSRGEADHGETADGQSAYQGAYSELFLLVCALLSRQLSQQHTCLPTHQIVLANPMHEPTAHCRIQCSHDELIARLAECGAVSSPRTPTGKAAATPIILDHGDLYLQRYFQFELDVSASLIRLAQGHVDEVGAASKACLDMLFPAASPDPAPAQQLANPDFDWQKIATATAMTRRLAVITGGPGTGKTTTVTKLLFLLTQQAPMTIRLVAPTGKAAARLSESIKTSKLRLTQELAAFAGDLDVTLLDRVPEQASTLHRLLGVIPGSQQFRHHRDNPLRLDLLVVDEASMVDLPMMHKLLSALPEHARLILLGDQDQLASVEAGAVLADICSGLKPEGTSAAGHDGNKWRMRYSEAYADTLSALTGYDLRPFVSQAPHIGDSLCMLMHSHRFKGDAGIGQLAGAVNNSDERSIARVWQRGYEELHWLDHQQTSAGNAGLAQLLSLAVDHYRHYLEMARSGRHSAAEIINRYNEFRILCAMRAGEYGVEGINQRVGQALQRAGLIATKLEFYQGRPVIIQSNDYNLGLFNGDIGLILADRQNNEPAAARLMAHFILADGSILKVLPARLPNHTTCFAMTVHKSQGSEFNSVALVLPPRPTPAQQQLLTKELLYTAITRAKRHFTCLGSHRVFNQASARATQRSSGLARRLWGT